MKHLIQPNRWTCLPTSFAMVLDVPFDLLLQDLGHDGSAIIDSSKPEPYNRQGFAPEEFVRVCYKYGYWCVPVYDNVEWIDFMLKTYTGVVCGELTPGCPHAMAWDRISLYDPKGFVYPLGRLKLFTEFWAVIRING